MEFNQITLDTQLSFITVRRNLLGEIVVKTESKLSDYTTVETVSEDTFNAWHKRVEDKIIIN